MNCFGLFLFWIVVGLFNFRGCYFWFLVKWRKCFEIGYYFCVFYCYKECISCFWLIFFKFCLYIKLWESFFCYCYFCFFWAVVWFLLLYRVCCRRLLILFMMNFIWLLICRVMFCILFVLGIWGIGVSKMLVMFGLFIV